MRIYNLKKNEVYTLDIFILSIFVKDFRIQFNVLNYEKFKSQKNVLKHNCFGAVIIKYLVVKKK